MRNIWEKVKNFFRRIWDGLTVAGRIIISLGILIIVILIAFAFAKDTDEEKHENNPQVVQVRKPSIGEPLAPHTPGEEESKNETDKDDSGSVAGESVYDKGIGASALTFISPATGIDDDKPIQYNNETFKFAAVLPAYSKVNEQADGVQFTSSSKGLHYIVSVNKAGSENLSGIESQLRNSPTASNISRTNFAGHEALAFNAKGFGSGIAFISNGNIYYLFGNQNLFADFRLL